MTLGRLIQILETMDQKRVIEFGFGEPHSYRGYYEQLAFVPMPNQSVKNMLKAAKSAVGKYFYGWKGGEFRMDLDTDIWFAQKGTTMDQDHSPSEIELAHMFNANPDLIGVVLRETAIANKDGDVVFVSGSITLPKKFKNREVEVTVKLK